MRILSTDYGTKRIGLTAIDPLKLIASGPTTVDMSRLLPFLEKYTAEEAIKVSVTGLLRRLSNEDPAVETDTQQLLTKLKEHLPIIKIHQCDECFTPKIVSQTMIDSGPKKKQQQNKASIDKINATLILQGFLNLAN